LAGEAELKVVRDEAVGQNKLLLAGGRERDLVEEDGGVDGDQSERDEGEGVARGEGFQWDHAVLIRCGV